ncbi:MAG: ATP-binding protein [candidate division KSB1 bacterium]|nr:ATP-binding protein [candidate division KSB1 bacterium]MDZ7273253.1 ATP-binding protein [candidate division KSB1 bacterium]MDZ7285355.1 ATP-binding protein [candidate division KSB1 bacterium]MDZ7298387.1 ATP-binding protein [candidate division KSB1 bacterium]MDZ7306465.1 ATP-binding protein [candidate division KSB1 bacterium]
MKTSKRKRAHLPGKTVDTVEFRVASDPKLLKIIRAGIAHLCELIGFTPQQSQQTTLAVDEACSNIIKYAYGGATDKPIIVTARVMQNGIEIILRDFGKKVVPAEIKSRDLNDLRPGGLGVHLIRSTMDVVAYDTSRKRGNILRLAKFFTSPSSAASTDQTPLMPARP